MNKKDLENYAKSVLKDNIITVDKDGLKFNLKKYLGFNDVKAYVNDIVSECFDTAGEYLPERFRFAVRNAFIKYYTDLGETKDEKYNDVLAYSVYENTIGNYEFCTSINFNVTQLSELEDAAERKITSILRDRSDEIKADLRKISEVFEYQVAPMNNLTEEDINSLTEALRSDNFTDRLVQSYAKEFLRTEKEQ